MASNTFIAILGRQPELGLVELESVLGEESVSAFGTHAVLSRAPSLDRLGGTVKLGEVLYRGPVTPLEELPIDLSALPRPESKLVFALSVYGERMNTRQLLAAGLTLKKRLRSGGSVRLLSPASGTETTAAQLRHNEVLKKGFELLCVYARNELIVARTTAVQDIDAYAARDYGRPARSATVGMLPPKLAQILINTTSSTRIYDPFCGTGVILQEALLMGREAAGSDLSPEMVQATRTNLEWLVGMADRHLPPWSVEEQDARKTEIPSGFAIASEGYLGPNQSHTVSPADAEALAAELLDLYVAALGRWADQLPSGGEVSMCAPAWRTRSGWRYLGIVDELPRLGYTMKRFKHARGPLLYSRADQFVGRQLLLLKRT